MEEDVEARQDQQPMNQRPSFKKSKENEDQELVPVVSMRYRNFRVQIFKQSGQPTRYFYEPILLLDPQKIQSQVNTATGKAYIRFPVQMWDEEVERQVVASLKKLPGSHDVEDLFVQVMPYDELRLTTSKDQDTYGAYHPSTNATPYRQLKQKLNFYLFAETKEAAESLVESFRMDPDYYIEGLSLECIIIKSAPVNESQRKRSRMSDGSNSSTDIVRSSSSLTFNLCTAGSSPPRLLSDGLSNPQVPVPSQRASDDIVEKIPGRPTLDDLLVRFKADGLKGPFSPVEVI